MEGARNKVADLKFDITEPLHRVRETAPANPRIDAQVPILLPKFVPRTVTPAACPAPFVLPPLPIEAPTVCLQTPYTVDCQDANWVHQTNTQRAMKGEPRITHEDCERVINEMEERMFRHGMRDGRMPSSAGVCIHPAPRPPYGASPFGGSRRTPLL